MIDVPPLKRTLSEPVISCGKMYKGDYGKSPQFISQLLSELESLGIATIANKILGVYYDDPRGVNPDELSSFQGVFLTDANIEIPEPLIKLSMEGSFLYVKVSGDPMQSIHEGYFALQQYVQDRNIKTKSSAGYQISSFDNGMFTTEIYLEMP